ncbi:uncharacterized protein METZ01_LOCUS348459, partial [marine metagenome]
NAVRGNLNYTIAPKGSWSAMQWREEDDASCWAIITNKPRNLLVL